MSTTEVAEVLGLVDFIKEANVYGVTVPGLWNLCYSIIYITAKVGGARACFN